MSERSRRSRLAPRPAGQAGGVRILHFVRHGQYVRDEEGERLTEKGRRQAAQTGGFLRQWRVASVTSSDTPRASETAALIAHRLDLETLSQSRALRELQPSWFGARRRPQVVARLDGLRQRFFKPAGEKRHEVLVCHGNLIRALVCRVLEVPLSVWPRMGAFHCGVTSFVTFADGEVSLLCFNATGHLPADLVTEG